MSRCLGTAVVVWALLSPALFAQENPFLPLQILAETVDPETGNRYQLTSVTTWLEANDFAQEQGGWLWAVNSSREMNLVIDSFLAARQTALDSYVTPEGFGGSPDGDLYIGLTDSDLVGFSCSIDGSCEGNFQWTNGDPVTFTNWSGGEPNNVGVGTDPAGEDFAEIWNLTGDRSWNDDNDRGSGLNGLPPSTPARLPAGGNFAVVELPPIPPPAILEVNSEGFARITSQEANSFQVRSYDITGDLPLDHVAWQATNLSARQENPAPGPGEGWQVINSADDQVFEAFLFGGEELGPGESIVIGKLLEDVPEGGLSLSLDLATSNWITGSLDTVASFGASAVLAEFDAMIDIPVGNDCNSDGMTDILDANCTPAAGLDDFLASIGSLRGDLDGDGTVAFADFLTLSGNFGNAGVYTDGDIDLSGEVGFSDFLTLSGSFGTSATGVASVPEPSCGAWCCVALFLCSTWSRRRRAG